MVKGMGFQSHVRVASKREEILPPSRLTLPKYGYFFENL